MDALEFLHRDFILNAPIIEALERNEAKLLSFTDYGVEALHNEGLLLLSLTHDDAIKHYEDKINEGWLTVFYGNEDSGRMPQLLPKLTRIVPCRQMVYAKKEPAIIDPEITRQTEFRLLDQTYAQFVFDNYSRRNNIEHIIHVIESKHMYGAFIGRQIAGFIGRHHDGSMGFLEILPPFRRKGLGRALECFLINQVLAEGRVPFGHVVVGNDISGSLQMSIDGVKMAGKLVSWISTYPR